MQKIWKVKPKILDEMANQYRGYDDLLAQLLYNRGLTQDHQIQEFLEPKYERLHSPFLFKDMAKAADRIWRAMAEGERIVIYGDYDADAVTANAVLRQTFNYLGYGNIESYIPDRFTEGYGVNLEALSKIKNEGSKVIITVDCGTNSLEAAKWCKLNGIDLIITDHHEIVGELPEAFALINPKNQADAYPDPDITGVGVAFKIAQAILKNSKLETRNSNFISGWEKWLLDLVTIGTVADCHSLQGENRILVKFGLMVLAKSKWPGLRALINSAGLNFNKQLPDTYTLGFILAPRLNAAGRLEHANTALNLLLETDPSEAQKQAKVLEELNKRRQDATARILSEAREKALLIRERKVLVLMDENWHKGVVGLVAGKIAEEFYRPAIVLQMENGQATGSARSVGEFNIVAALKYSQSHLLRFGGHKAAAGLSLDPVNFESFYKSLLDYAEQNLNADDLLPSLELETELSEFELTPNAYNLIASLEPFGVGNPRPKFLIKNAIVSSQRQVGSMGQHLQLQVQVGEKAIPAIAFNFRPVSAPGLVDIACELINDGWNGRQQLKLKIIEIKHPIIQSFNH